MHIIIKSYISSSKHLGRWILNFNGKINVHILNLVHWSSKQEGNLKSFGFIYLTIKEIACHRPYIL